MLVFVVLFLVFVMSLIACMFLICLPSQRNPSREMSKPRTTGNNAAWGANQEARETSLLQKKQQMKEEQRRKYLEARAAKNTDQTKTD
mmetsp:Transcript_19423/g.30431  ORF Transcript_19423/g.30431 Transcript_19423/m.30431 type:complete len:88 (+) Transcript_19423:127-390(+)